MEGWLSGPLEGGMVEEESIYTRNHVVVPCCPNEIRLDLQSSPLANHRPIVNAWSGEDR